jgi:tetratricopeptide (TPR) repeat protein
MQQLGHGLSEANHYEDALSVQEAELSTLRRIGVPEEQMLVAQSNLANTYQALGRLEPALRMRRDAYSKSLGLYGADDLDTLQAANNYASSLNGLQRFEEAKFLLRKIIPVARRVAGESHENTLRMRWLSAEALYLDTDATLDDLREAVTTLEEIERTARRVLGVSHPTTSLIEVGLRKARAALRAREDSV